MVPAFVRAVRATRKPVRVEQATMAREMAASINDGFNESVRSSSVAGVGRGSDRHRSHQRLLGFGLSGAEASMPVLRHLGDREFGGGAAERRGGNGVRSALDL